MRLRRVRAGRLRRADRCHPRSERRRDPRRHGGDHQRRDEPAAGCDFQLWRRLCRHQPAPGALPSRRRALRLQARDARRCPRDDGRSRAHRCRDGDRRDHRPGDCDGRCAGAAQRDRKPGAGGAAGAHRPAPVERTDVHHAGGADARRRAASRLSASAHQRRSAANQRIPVRRHLGPAAGTGPGRLLPRRRRDRGLPDREQQRASGVRPLQRRRHQPDHPGRHQHHSWRRLRVPAQRSAERAQLLSAGASGQARIQAQSVRRHARRPHRPRSHLLLPRLPGTAPGHRPHGDFDGADGTAAAGHLHRSNRRPRAGPLRPVHDRCGDVRAHAVPGQRDSGRPHGPCCGGTAAAVSVADVDGYGEQLSTHRERARRPGSVGRTRRSPLLVEPRLRVREDDGIPGPLHARHSPSGRQRRHLGDPWPATDAGPRVRLELSACVRGERAERGACRRHPAPRRPGCRSPRRSRKRCPRPPGHSVERAVPDDAAHVSDRRLSAARFAAEHRVELRHERHAGRGFADVGHRPPHVEIRRRLAMGTAQRHSTAVTNRVVHLQRARQRPARRREHRNAARELPSRPSTEFIGGLAAVCHPGARALRRALRPGRLEGDRSSHGERRLALHTQLPVEG